MSAENTRSETEQTSASRPLTYLHGCSLPLARVAWLLIAFIALILFALSIIPRANELMRTSDEVGRLVLRQLGEAERATLARHGLSMYAYAWYVTAFEVLAGTVCAVVGLFIFIRNSRDWMAMFGAMTVILTGMANNTYMAALAFTQPAWRAPVAIVMAVGAASFITFLYLFPDGRFVPRWARWLPLLVVVVFVAGNVLFLDELRFSELAAMGRGPALLYGLVWVIPAAIGVYGQVSRYQHVSEPVQRQQSKWVLAGLLAVFLLILANAPLLLYLPFTQSVTPRVVYAILVPPIFTVSTLLLPLSISVAILRYHLYEIDVVINRTLVYGLLTALLGLAYTGSVIVLQQVFRPLLGADSELATVGATLIIAACFQPLRRWIQATIDRRFYRRKYDAAKTLAAFATQLRHETDLQRLVDDTLAVVEETVQPSHVSLWLREDRGEPMRPSRG